MAHVEDESGGAGTDQRSKGHARIENSDDAAGIASAEIIHNDRRKNGDPSSIKEAKQKREHHKRPEPRRESPDCQGERHADKRGEKKRLPSHAFGDSTQEKPPRRAARADRATQQYGGGLRDSTIQGDRKRTRLTP